jgi:hypothetical protein
MADGFVDFAGTGHGFVLSCVGLKTAEHNDAGDHYASPLSIYDITATGRENNKPYQKYSGRGSA